MDRLAILVGGGPAPGINAVIAAATIRACLEGVEVVGIRDGFEWLIQDRADLVVPLTIDTVSRIHFRGGSCLGISRANPTASPMHMDAAIRVLERLGVSQAITIGGDGTARCAAMLEARATGRIRVVHVPKTIDNDVDLPPHVDTFGYQSARHYGVEIVQNLMVDAKTTSRWYFVATMGQQAGHLALGIGKAAGATLTLIPEEFARPTKLETIVDTLTAAIVKRMALGRKDGVAIIAEGVVVGLSGEEGGPLHAEVPDMNGHVRISDLNIAETLRTSVLRELGAIGVTATIAAKTIGYELRCADPIPLDMEYARDLGYCAAQYLLSGGRGAVVSMQGGRFTPIPFEAILDPVSGRTRVRFVDTASTRFQIAHQYMVRVRPNDFTDARELERLAAVTSLRPHQFRDRFGHLVSAPDVPV